jgi:hypothetical protein
MSQMARTFPRFQQLPPEVRLRVWEYALPPRRTIFLVKEMEEVVEEEVVEEEVVKVEEEVVKVKEEVVEEEVLQVGRRRRRKPQFESYCRSTIPCPRELISLLHLCAESRRVVLKHYKALFSPRSLGDPKFTLHYFDPWKDKIFIHNIFPWGRGGNNRPAALFQTRHLSIQCNAWWSMWRRDKSRKTLLGREGLLKFRHLEELHIVFRLLTKKEKDMMRDYLEHDHGEDLLNVSAFRRPHDIDFDGPNVYESIDVEAIMEEFKALKAANPTWQVPKVRRMGWSTSPYFCNEWLNFELLSSGRAGDCLFIDQVLQSIKEGED